MTPDFTSSLTFAVDGTADAVRAGTKRVTRRLAKDGKPCRWREGALARAYERDPRTGAKPFGAVRILSVQRERLVEITEADVKLEGTEATTRRGFVRLFAELHSLDAARLDEVFVWRIGFRLLAADETPPFGGVR